MQLPSPIATVASALHHAAYVALPLYTYETRDLSAMRGWSAEKRMEAMRTRTEPRKTVARRPDESQCEVHAMFAQTWGSTSLGFGGIGGAAMTPAYTVVIRGPGGDFAVYWNGRLAYTVDPTAQTTEQLRAFQEDLTNRDTASCMQAVVRYGARTGSIDD